MEMAEQPATGTLEWMLLVGMCGIWGGRGFSDLYVIFTVCIHTYLRRSLRSAYSR